MDTRGTPPGSPAAGSLSLSECLERVQKPFLFEKLRGFGDKVAAGGLSLYCLPFIDAALAQACHAEVRQRLTELRELLGAYSSLSVEERRNILARAEALIERTRAEAFGLTPTQAGEKTLLDAMQTDVQYLKGVGPRIAERLRELGIRSVYDLLFHVPFRHEDRRNPTPIASLTDGQVAGVLCKILSQPEVVRRRPNLQTVHVVAADSTGDAELTWFNQPWLRDRLKPGDTVFVFGKARVYRGNLSIGVSDHEVVTDPNDPLQLGAILPVYPLVSGLTQRKMRQIVLRALDQFASTSGENYDPIPTELRKRHDLPGFAAALRAVHYPADRKDYQRGRRRLVYQEFLVLQCELARRRLRARGVSGDRGIRIEAPPSLVAELEAALGFTLTNAQRRAINEILSDLRGPGTMNRLLHGEVGSGKTAVALATLAATVRAGHQAALMAPTEILAEQHFYRSREPLAALGISAELLTGSRSVGEKQRIYETLRNGGLNVVFGTHALIQRGVEFRSLATAIVDEQQRFGVRHRAQLIAKGRRPHVLVMTATPIPRTLALTVYGDLDISVLDEMPTGARDVVTQIASKRAAYELLRKEVNEGRQGYVVCPIIEESEALEVEAATQLISDLAAGPLQGLKLGLLHGRLSPAEREREMSRFYLGQTQVLVCTSVVEVGIDVRNASVIVVENAERFGLAQLHQLRGRIGRGGFRAYCILICGTRSPESRERLRVLTETSDGFQIAEQDLAIRGPGEFLGTRQSGLPDLRIADILGDVDLLKLARQDAFALIEADPQLKRSDCRALALEIELRVRGKVNLALIA